MRSCGLPADLEMRSVVAGKARVHELAKELGVSSKVVLTKLNELGEFVKSASSTVEAPVARRLREVLTAQQSEAKPAKAPAKAPKPAAKKTPAKRAIPTPPAPAPARGPAPRPAPGAAPRKHPVRYPRFWWRGPGPRGRPPAHPRR